MCKNNLYKRYRAMEEKAGEQEIGTDFREGVAEVYRIALKEGRENITLAELLPEIEEWNKHW